MKQARANPYQLRSEDRILYIRLSAIGDVVNAIPGLVALRRSFPDSYIAWCVQEHAAEILRGHPCLDDLLVVENSLIRHPMALASRAGWQALRKKMRELRFTVAIDAHNLFKSGLIALYSGAKIRIGANLDRNYEGHKWFLNVLAGPPRMKASPGQPSAVRRAQFLQYIGVDVSKLEYVLPPLTEAAARVESILAAGEVSPRDRLVVVNPCASRSNKQWPGEHYAELARLLVHGLGLRVIWTGSASERAYIGGLASGLGVASLNLAGQLDLRELTALMQRAGLIVSGDTGPLHLGAAAGAFVVGIFGPTDPEIHGPYTERKIILAPCHSCRFCGQRKCSRQAQCLAEITPEDVFSAVEHILDKTD